MGKYLKQTPNFSTQLSVKTGHSTTLKNLNLGWYICQKDLKWTLGTGMNICLWHDRWMPNNKTLRETIQGPLQKYEETQTVNSILDKKGLWLQDKISTRLSDNLKQSIARICISFTKRADKEVWYHNLSEY